MQSGKGLIILAACLCLVMTEARRKLKRHDIEEEKSTEEFDEDYDDVCSIRYLHEIFMFSFFNHHDL